MGDSSTSNQVNLMEISKAKGIETVNGLINSLIGVTDTGSHAHNIS